MSSANVPSTQIVRSPNQLTFKESNENPSADDNASVPLLKNDNKIITPRLLLPRPNVPIQSAEGCTEDTNAERCVPAPRKRTAETRKRKHSVEPDHESDVKVPKSEETSSQRSRRATSPSLQDTSVERPRNVEKIIYGRYQIGTWYYSPYPSEYGDKVEELFICEHCLKYTVQDAQLRAHKLHCKKRKPPGQVIYQQGNIKIYEVDGREHKLYCQNLCLMSKLFLETKTLYYDVEGFTFYVLTEQDRTLDLFVGYFSKEKISYDNYNLACIMVLPPQQRKGYGRLLIELSYELSRHEGVIGSPEKPLSTLGALGYRSYWASSLVANLRDFRGRLTIQELSRRTCIHTDDVIDTLSWLGMLKYRNKDLVETDNVQHGAVQVHITSDMLENALAEHHLRLTNKLDPTLIRWKYIDGLKDKVPSQR